MLRVSSSPHIRDNSSTQRIMLDVVLALIPMVIASVFIFGWRALLIYAVSVVSSVVFEALSRLIMKREQTINDLSAVVTGLLLAAGLPAGYPIWMVVVGAFVAIVFVKQLFGGLGSNFANPAVTARIVLAVSFPAETSSFSVLPQYAHQASLTEGVSQYDLVTSATPLGMSAAELPSGWDLFLGRHAGSIGEVCILALLIGAAYLLIRGVIDLWIPLVYLGTTAVLITLAGGDPLFHLLSGAVVLAAFFMLTDYVTSPTTVAGKIIFAIGAAALTFLLRMYSSMPEGVSYSILLMNILTPHIERWTAHKTIGGNYAKKADKTPKAADKDKTRLIERGFMPAVILTIIAVVSITLLALTEYTTADARAYQEQFMADTNKRAIFIDADSFPAEELDRAGASLEGGKAVDFSGADSIIKEVYLAEKDGSTIGLLITVKPGGYGGTLNMMLGYDLEGNAVGLTIDASTQTAGLGSKVGEDNFIRQFSGFKAADTVSSDNTADFQVDGISGATISSNAVFKGINAGNKAAQQMLGLE